MSIMTIYILSWCRDQILYFHFFYKKKIQGSPPQKHRRVRGSTRPVHHTSNRVAPTDCEEEPTLVQPPGPYTGCITPGPRTQPIPSPYAAPSLITPSYRARAAHLSPRSGVTPALRRPISPLVLPGCSFSFSPCAVALFFLSRQHNTNTVTPSHTLRRLPLLPLISSLSLSSPAMAFSGEAAAAAASA